MLFNALSFIPTDAAKPPELGFPLLWAEWTLRYELLFYLIFCLVLFVTHKYRSLVASALIILSVVGLQKVFTGTVTLTQSQAGPVGSGIWSYANLLANPKMLEFVFGMAIAEVFIRVQSVDPRVARALFALSLGYFIFVYASGFGLYGNIMVVSIPSAALVSSWLACEKSNAFAAPRVLMLVGDWSFSIYIIHQVIHTLIELRMANFEIIKWSQGASLIILECYITLIVSAISYYLVEKSASKILLKIFIYRNQKSSEVDGAGLFPESLQPSVSPIP